MSIDYFVLPLDPDNLDIRAWLDEDGIDFPNIKGRYPTLNELLEVLHSFDDLAVQILQDSPMIVSLGVPDEPGYAYLLGEIEPDGYFHFSFWGWRNQDFPMATILQRLCVFCGAFILLESYNATPMLISKETNLEDAIQGWNERFQKKHLE